MADIRVIRFDGENIDLFISQLTEFQKDLEKVSMSLSNISARIEETKDWKDFGKEEMETYMKLVAKYGEMLAGLSGAGKVDADSHISQLIEVIKEHKEIMSTYAQNTPDKDECITWLDSAQ